MASGLIDLKSHGNALLTAGRCARCAELVPRVAIVRAGQCPACESALAWSGQGDLEEALQTRRNRWRIAGYLLVALGSASAGAIPLLQFVVQVAALLILHVIVLRRELAWLGAGRRILARLTIKLLGAAIACVALLVNVAIAPFVGVSIGVLAIAAPLMTAAYVEGGLIVIRQRMRWEIAGRPLSPIEWLLPAAAVGALVLALLATVGLVATTLHLIANADIPTVSEIAIHLRELFE